MTVRRSRQPKRAISEINMTPLIDLTFLLLITFIITFPLIEHGLPVRLPSATAEPMDDPQSVSVTLDAEGRLFLDQAEIGLDDLQEIIESKLIGNPDLSVMVRGDKRLNYGEIVRVLRVLRRARVTRMALVTSQED